jgi:hypothetical protein
MLPPSASTLAVADLAPASPDAAINDSVVELTDFEHGVIDIFVRLADVLGIPKSVGEIYGLLFATAHPLAFQAIVLRLGISKGSASQGLRLLRAVGAIKLTYVGGDRRDHFLPETELRALLSGFLRERVQPHLEGGGIRVKALKAVTRSRGFGRGDPEDARILRARIEKLGAWHKKGEIVLPLVAKFFR